MLWTSPAMVGWPWPASRPHPVAPSCTPQQNRGRKRDGQALKCVEIQTVLWEKQSCAWKQSKWGEFIRCFQSAGQFLRGRASVGVVVDPEDKCCNHNCPPASSFPPASTPEHHFVGCEIVLWSVPSSLLPTCGQGGEGWRSSPGAVGAPLHDGQKAGGVLSPALEPRRQSTALCGLPG